jgi:hypothetical protein
MTIISASAASAAAPLALGPNLETSATLAAAGLLLPHLERGERVDAATLRAAMETAFGASDASGAWHWKTAYDACEAATVLFLRKYGRALFRKAGSPASRLSALSKIASLLPTHTRRSAESQTFQQFSTPIPLGLVAAQAAAITPADRVLEPSAGTGLLAILAEITGGALVLNELADSRADLLSFLFPAIPVNLAETQAFMDDQKRILIFSDAGGTGRSYHADLSARNTRLRVHYLLEPGWKADAAIQGLGRTHRTNQAQPPLFRPIATDVKAEKRFLSTIARRLDTLGAITRGQRQTGGQGLFRPEDNLESAYARDALRQLYLLLVRGKVEGCSLERFESATGLKLMDTNGLKDELPPITTFLNRLLALTIELQGILFTAFDQLLTAKIEGAIAAGIYDVGLETLTAESFAVTGRQTIYTHPGTSAETRLLTIAQQTRNRPVKLDDALAYLGEPGARLLINERSGRAAVQIPTTSIMLDDGEVERRKQAV